MPDPRSLADLISSSQPEDLLLAAADPRMTKELALEFLSHRELPSRSLEFLARNPNAAKHRKVLVALVSHPATPRFVSLPITRRLFTFELMQIALSPTVATDVKMAADHAIVSRLDSVSSGERFTLAKQASTRVAAALLTDPEERIIEAALNNPRLTEVEIVKALKHDVVPQSLIAEVCAHAKWSLRTEIQIEVLKSPHTPLAQAIMMADKLPHSKVEEVLRTSRMPENVRAYLLHLQATRKRS